MKVGQKVVCIKHFVTARGYRPITKGQTYTVLAIGPSCKCGVGTVDVGVSAYAGLNQYSCKCGYSWSDGSGAWWIDASFFAPLEEKGDTMIEDILRPI